jgi:hypothetical protein
MNVNCFMDNCQFLSFQDSIIFLFSWKKFNNLNHSILIIMCDIFNLNVLSQLFAFGCFKK